jgi:hypothetical protein
VSTITVEPTNDRDQREHHQPRHPPNEPVCCARRGCPNPEPSASRTTACARDGSGSRWILASPSTNTGIVIPAAILGVGTVSSGASTDLIWLAILTAATLGALATRGGMGRLAGLALVGGYVAFVVAHLI